MKLKKNLLWRNYRANLNQTLLKWTLGSPFKIVSVSAVLYPRWRPLLKIEISSNGQNCSILSQKVPKFELYKHNDELFSSPGRWTIAITWRPSSVVCKLFTFQASSPKPLGRLEPNLAGMFLGWSSTKLLFFVPVGYSIWLPRPIICSDWLKFQRSSSLKLMNLLNPNCTWMIIGMSFTKLLFFMPIGNPRWPPSQDID